MGLRSTGATIALAEVTSGVAGGGLPEVNGSAVQLLQGPEVLCDVGNDGQLAQLVDLQRRRLDCKHVLVSSIQINAITNLC